MFESKTIQRADFCRATSSTSIDVFLMDSKTPIYLFKDKIDRFSKNLSKNEIDSVIQILQRKKEVMTKEDNFPDVYDEMLTDLITVYKERYGVKKGKNWKNHYTLSINQLEELLEQRYKFKGVRVDSITAGRKDRPMTKIDVGSGGILFVSFREVEEDEC